MKKARVNMSRIFRCDAKTLFESIQEGALFKFTGVEMGKANIDFKEGGKFAISWSDYGTCNGIFKEVKPFEKIVFTWDCTTNENMSENIGSLVTITIKEKAGKSILTLIHDNIENHMYEDMSLGWDDTLSDLRKSFREIIARLENNKTGLDLYFKMKKDIQLPRSKVFQYVYDKKHLEKYFKQKSSGPLAEGATVTWKFEGHEAFTINVHQVIENEMIKFLWPNRLVINFGESRPLPGFELNVSYKSLIASDFEKAITNEFYIYAANEADYMKCVSKAIEASKRGKSLRVKILNSDAGYYDESLCNGREAWASFMREGNQGELVCEIF